MWKLMWNMNRERGRRWGFREKKHGKKEEAYTKSGFILVLLWPRKKEANCLIKNFSLNNNLRYSKFVNTNKI